MSTVGTTRMSSKGQVVIPEEVRERLGLEAGTQFVVLGERDVVILRAVSPPSMDQFDDLIAESRRAARRAGLKKRDVGAATDRARKRARRKKS